MEVIAAEPTGHIHDFSDEVKTENLAALHGASVKFIGRDAASGDFGLGIAFSSSWDDAPRVKSVLKLGQRGIGRFVRLGLRCVEAQPAIGETLRQRLA